MPVASELLLGLPYHLEACLPVMSEPADTALSSPLGLEDWEQL